MDKMIFGLLLSVILISFSQIAASQPRCECTASNWIGDCNARISLEGNWIKLRSNTKQCSRIDWYANEDPQTTIVTDGTESEEWLGQDKNPKLSISGCKICKDRNYTESRSRQDGQNSKSNLEQLFSGTWRHNSKNAGNLTINITDGQQFQHTANYGNNGSCEDSGSGSIQDGSLIIKTNGSCRFNIGSGSSVTRNWTWRCWLEGQNVLLCSPGNARPMRFNK